MQAPRSVVTLLLVIALFTVAAKMGSPQGPLPGQIIVNPENPSWFVYNRDRNDDGRLDPFFLCGPGDPEDFLYRGSRNSDGTRAGDQMRLIGKMQGTGANSIYLMAVRSHGGDGDATQNPFVDSDPARGLDDEILSQWEEWFAAMDRLGIVIFFFFYDDGARIWSGNSVGAEERAFIRELVEEFKHHRHLIWVVAEEYGEKYSPARIRGIAAEIRDADEHTHPIAVHKRNGLDFSEFSEATDIDQFAIQYKASSPSEFHRGIVSAWHDAAGRYNLNLAETAEHGAGESARHLSWAAAMAGAYVMVFGMDIAGTAISDLMDCGRLVRFMESTNFDAMEPHDELALGGTEYVLAEPGEQYIAYAADSVRPIGLRNLRAGNYRFRWFDPGTGATVIQDGLQMAGGDQTWERPAGIGRETAVFIQFTGEPEGGIDDSSRSDHP